MVKIDKNNLYTSQPDQTPPPQLPYAQKPPPTSLSLSWSLKVPVLTLLVLPLFPQKNNPP